MPEIDCQGECSWIWIKNAVVEYWNFVEENTTCSIYCSCSSPVVSGEFDGQVVFTPCQPPTENSMRMGETQEEYQARLQNQNQ